MPKFTNTIFPGPQSVSEYVCRGEIYCRCGRAASALRNFNKAIKLEPDNTWAYASRGRLHGDNDAPCRAISDLDSALELD